MKRKKNSSIEDVKLTDVTPTPGQKVKKDLSDVADIKRKMAKVNLYLSLLNKPLFETVPVNDVDVAADIENEINDFIISRAKSIFSSENGVEKGFSTSELAFLKLLSRKGTEKVADPLPVTAPAPQPVVEVQQPKPAVVARPVVNGSKPNVVRRTVSIIGEDGNPKEVEVETEKMVLPPSTVKRNPPASFEQQMARAAADVAAVQRAMGTSSGPLVVDSTDSAF